MNKDKGTILHFTKSGQRTDPRFLVAPEMGVSHGYCDFFLMPDFYAKSI